MEKDTLITQWEEKFHECLSFDFSNPAYFNVHHILVPTYLLQTGGYNKIVRPQVLKLLEDFLADPSKKPTASAFKKEKQGVTIRSVDAGAPLFTEKSILDIRIDTPDHYCEDVIQWSGWLVDQLHKSHM